MAKRPKKAYLYTKENQDREGPDKEFKEKEIKTGGRKINRYYFYK